MKKIKIIRILFILFTLFFICTLPFSIFNRLSILNQGKLTSINGLVLLFNIVEFFLYAMAMILFIIKSDKTISVFNSAVFLTLIYSCFILATTYIPLIYTNNPVKIFSEIAGAISFLMLIIYFVFLTNKIGLKYHFDEIGKIGEKEIL